MMQQFNMENPKNPKMFSYTFWSINKDTLACIK